MRESATVSSAFPQLAAGSASTIRRLPLDCAAMTDGFPASAETPARSILVPVVAGAHIRFDVTLAPAKVAPLDPCLLRSEAG